MKHHFNSGPFVLLSLSTIIISQVSSVRAENPLQFPDERAPQITGDIEHATTITPIAEVEIFALPEVGVRTDTRSALSNNGDIYVGGGGHLWKSTDRGETWILRELPQRAAGGFGILNDDIFILVLYSDDHSYGSVLRSTDYGNTWSAPVALDFRPFNYCGGGWSDVYQHPDGTALITMTLRNRSPGNRFHDYIFRSSDGGKTWGDPTLLIPYSAESTVLALRNSDRMLAYSRAQRVSLPEDPDDFWKQTGASEGNSWPLKNGVVAESNDAGRTWHHLRLFDTYGSVPGELLQTSDGRLAAVWLQRYPYEDAEIRVRISTDGGRSWQKQTYSLIKGHGYPSSVVYPDGTIVTVCENTKFAGGRPRDKRTMAAARWRLPDTSP